MTCEAPTLQRGRSSGGKSVLHLIVFNHQLNISISRVEALWVFTESGVYFVLSAFDGFILLSVAGHSLLESFFFFNHARSLIAITLFHDKLPPCIYLHASHELWRGTPGRNHLPNVFVSVCAQLLCNPFPIFSLIKAALSFDLTYIHHACVAQWAADVALVCFLCGTFAVCVDRFMFDCLTENH